MRTRATPGRRPVGCYLLPVALSAALALLLADASRNQSWAQQAVTESADPAEIRRRIEDRELPARPRDPDIEIAPQAVPTPVEDQAPAFVLSAVVIEGATAFGMADFGPLYEDHLARSVTFADIEDILSRVTDFYRDHGYFLSRAIATPQDVTTGILRIAVVEGFIETVTLEGDVPDPEQIEAYSQRILEQRPLTLARFERTLILINDLAGISIGANLEPADEASGAYALTLKVDYDAVDGSAYMDNRGTRAVGRLETWLSGGMNSVLGLGERVQVGLFTVPNQPKELIYFDVTYEQPIDRNGTYISLQGSRSDSDAGGSLRALDSESDSSSATISVWHPVIRSRKQNLWLVGSLGYLGSSERRQGAVLFEDRTRVARLSASYSLTDNLSGTTGINVGASKGLDIFGASRRGAAQLSRFDGRSDFAKFTAEVSRDQSLIYDFALAVSVRGQKSTVPLLSSEEFGVGGIRYGRAYDSSEITGEDGAAGSVELRYDMQLDKPYLQALQVYGFYDIGAVWNIVPGGSSVRASLASVGGGIRLTVTPSLFATVEVAQPLTRVVANEGDDDPRAFFSLAAQF